MDPRPEFLRRVEGEGGGGMNLDLRIQNEELGVTFRGFAMDRDEHG